MDREKLKKYSYENVASLFWSSFLITGGAIFVSYYAYIGYMPEFDFKSSITILCAASITAILTVLLFMTILILPGAYWSSVWADESPLKFNWEDPQGQKKFFKTSAWFGLPVLYFFTLFTMALTAPYWAILYSIVGFIAFCVFIHGRSSLSKWNLLKEVGKMIGVSAICAILAFLPLYLVAKLSVSGVSTSKGPPVIVGIVVAFFVAFINVLATSKPNNTNQLFYFSGLGLASMFIIFASFEIFHRIPERVMEIYKFGAIDARIVVFDNKACRTLKIQGFISEVKPKEQCSIKNVKILSRLGKQAYMEKNGIKVTIDSASVLSWSVEEPSNKLLKE